MLHRVCREQYQQRTRRGRETRQPPHFCEHYRQWYAGPRGSAIANRCGCRTHTAWIASPRGRRIILTPEGDETKET